MLFPFPVDAAPEVIESVVQQGARMRRARHEHHPHFRGDGNEGGGQGHQRLLRGPGAGVVVGGPHKVDDHDCKHCRRLHRVFHRGLPRRDASHGLEALGELCADFIDLHVVPDAQGRVCDAGVQLGEERHHRPSGLCPGLEQHGPVDAFLLPATAKDMVLPLRRLDVRRRRAHRGDDRGNPRLQLIHNGVLRVVVFAVAESDLGVQPQHGAHELVQLLGAPLPVAQQQLRRAHREDDYCYDRPDAAPHDDVDRPVPGACVLRVLVVPGAERDEHKGEQEDDKGVVRFL
mmetsp:Transcript_127808/g.361776  ORF Transcript_127808/g.361776 Transcript_127808/m.361776 type:complete len:288 (-) Transcript_127808:837-1700(-)